MSKSIKVAKRYSLGLWDFVLANEGKARAVADMKSLISLIKSSKDLQIFLNSPLIDTYKKIEIIKEITKGYSSLTQKFIVLVFRHKRENSLLEIAQQFLYLYEDSQGIERVTLISATKLDSKLIDQILDANSLIINKDKVLLNNIVDKSILGGYILRVKDKQEDLSVRTKLAQVKKKLEEKVF